MPFAGIISAVTIIVSNVQYDGDNTTIVTPIPFVIQWKVFLATDSVWQDAGMTNDILHSFTQVKTVRWMCRGFVGLYPHHTSENSRVMLYTQGVSHLCVSCSSEDVIKYLQNIHSGHVKIIDCFVCSEISFNIPC